MGCVLTKKRKLPTENLWICPLSSVGSRESRSISGRQFSSSFPITSPFHLPPNGQLSFRVMRSCSQSKKWFLWNWASATLRFRGRANSDVKWEGNTEWPPISITVSFKNFIYLFIYLFWWHWIFVAVCGLSLVVNRGYSLVAMHGLIAVASHHRAQTLGC